jgi:hypothetical protein
MDPFHLSLIHDSSLQCNYPVAETFHPLVVLRQLCTSRKDVTAREKKQKLQLILYYQYYCELKTSNNDVQYQSITARLVASRILRIYRFNSTSLIWPKRQNGGSPRNSGTGTVQPLMMMMSRVAFITTYQVQYVVYGIIDIIA